MPAPPPGYGYVTHPQYGWVMVALQPTAPPPPVARPADPWGPPPQNAQPWGAPMRQPAPQGMAARPHPDAFPGDPPGHPGDLGQQTGGRVLPFRSRTCVLVKPGDRDTYAELLARTPDLVPAMPDVEGYDATDGRPSPLSQQLLAEHPDLGVTAEVLNIPRQPVAAQATHQVPPDPKGGDAA